MAVELVPLSVLASEGDQELRQAEKLSSAAAAEPQALSSVPAAPTWR